MIHDWSYDYIYLRQLETVTHINLRDVAKTPVNDFESTTSKGEKDVSWQKSSSQ